jgi:hypothetical protein
MNRILRPFARIFLTIVAIAIAAFLWLYRLEELGFGTWECWIR